MGPLHESLRLSPAGDARGECPARRWTDFETGVASGRYRIAPSQLSAMVALLAGGTLAAMLPVLDGHGTWREVAPTRPELLLAALGVDRDESRALARSELPQLAGGAAS